MSKPTSIKTTEAVRDRLRVLAEEEHTTITDLLEDLANSRPTRAEREAQAREVAAYLGVEYTPELRQKGQSAWDRVAAHAEAQRHRPGSAA